VKEMIADDLGKELDDNGSEGDAESG